MTRTPTASKPLPEPVVATPAPRPSSAEPQDRRAGPRLRHRQAQERHRPRLDQAGQGQDHHQRPRPGDLFRPPGAAHDDRPAAAGRRPRSASSTSIATVQGSGLSGQAGAIRHGISKALTYYEPGLRAGAEAARLPDPRQPRGRAQEVRQGQGPPQLPVLEALDARSVACSRGRFGQPRRSFRLAVWKPASDERHTGLHRRRGRHHRPADPRAAGARARPRARLHRPGAAQGRRRPRRAA